MPGLVRGVARTAVVAGTATAVSNRVSRRQAERWSGQQAQQAYAEPAPQVVYAAPPPAPEPAAGMSMDEKYAQLKQIADLKAAGILTEAEFEVQKAKILNS